MALGRGGLGAGEGGTLLLLSAARALASWQLWPPFRKLESAKWKIITLFTLKCTGHRFFFR